jgi:hypothetical protein
MSGHSTDAEEDSKSIVAQQAWAEIQDGIAVTIPATRRAYLFVESVDPQQLLEERNVDGLLHPLHLMSEIYEHLPLHLKYNAQDAGKDGILKLATLKDLQEFWAEQGWEGEPTMDTLPALYWFDVKEEIEDDDESAGVEEEEEEKTPGEFIEGIQACEAMCEWSTSYGTRMHMDKIVYGILTNLLELVRYKRIKEEALDQDRMFQLLQGLSHVDGTRKARYDAHRALAMDLEPAEDKAPQMGSTLLTEKTFMRARHSADI